MADFEAAIKKVLEVEGLYDNHPDDPGGETKYGVTQAVARAHGYDGPMVEMPLETALEVYRKNYWNKIGGDDIADQRVADELLDTAVNMGVGKAVLFLQSSLNLLNKKAASWPDISEDGGMGPGTVGALTICLKMGTRYRDALVKCLNGEQYGRYKEITKANPKNEVFFLGWILKRVF